MPFVKGQSGNPSGRPKILLPDGRSLKDLAREHTEDAVLTLLDVMKDASAPKKDRIAAAEAVLDRGWGKPTQEFDAGENLANMMIATITRQVVDVKDEPKQLTAH